MASSTLQQVSFPMIRESHAWNNPLSKKTKELLMHQIHVYPAKFPSFLAKKAIAYIEKEKNQKIETVGDIFCGCGTTALEARLSKKNFWGCDINPVAVLISKVKRNKYSTDKIEEYRELILANAQIIQKAPSKILNHERIKYWFDIDSINSLYSLLKSIRENTPPGKYRDFFLVAFSNILKRTSRWLSKSIKPTIDPNKKPQPIMKVFGSQLKSMIKAVGQSKGKIDVAYDSQIENRNFLKLRPRAPFLDLLITSPPYVTSYEYADLHQLSTLWLGFVKDHRELRNGTIGSVYNTNLAHEDKNKLNPVGKEIYEKLLKTNAKSKTSILKYFIDLKTTVKKSYSLIKKGGYAAFVIGNTKFKGVYIDNAKYLLQCLFDSGFKDFDIKKRKISSKKLTPYRDTNGKFSTDKRHRKVYSYEFILIARK